MARSVGLVFFFGLIYVKKKLHLKSPAGAFAAFYAFDEPYQGAQMDIGMKAFYQQPRQARRAMEELQSKGLHVKKIYYYKKKWGNVENFNARGNVKRRIGKSLVYGAAVGFLLGGLVAFFLLSFNVMGPFQDMGNLGTILSVAVIGMFTLPAFTTAVAAVFSESSVDVADTDFNGDQVVVDFKIEREERDIAENLLRKNGANNVLSE